ncbi:NAD+ synthase [Candidatus Chordibacter forsetii]|uniref:NAD+ synthase n=1 Tax=Candidatus Chordibacter forsetii TaxID=3381758 RepID=UPI003899A092
MKIGIAQINTTVGDLTGNFEILRCAYDELSSDGADLVIFPELALSGYPPRDLLLKKRFGEDCAEKLNQFAKLTGECPALLGYPEKIGLKQSRSYYNSAALCFDGEVKQVFRKRLLPTYDVFDEDRYFESGKSPLYFSLLGKKIAVSICEDIWNSNGNQHSENPITDIAKEKLDLLINLSASPWHVDKKMQRSSILQEVVQKINCPLIYVNSVGGNDELIFDGSSVVLDSSANPTHFSPSFESSCQIVDLEKKVPIEHLKDNELQCIRQAIVLGLRDYTHKSGFKKGLIGLSGGIDSALTAALAVEALGRDNVIGISLPSSISSDHSKDDARDLAENLGIEYHTLPIQKIVDSAESELAPLFAGMSPDVTEENLQARSRGLLLMAVSNKLGALLLTTGNKSELAVGYCTLYGDMCGGLAVISDIPKTKVFALARHMNLDGEIIPLSTIEKPPSAELRPDQKDSDSLPEYNILDGILQSYIEDGLSIHAIIDQGYTEHTVRRIVGLVDRNEYKRKQAAPGLKITSLAFGIGRRMPIVQKYSN